MLDPVFTPYLKHYVTPDVSLNMVTSFPPQYFSGVQLINLYNVPTVVPSNGAKKVTIAIIVAFTYPNLKSDLLTYWQNPINFGANSVPPNINIYTTPGATRNSGWAQEECMDVQIVCTMNPNANIWVVEAKSDSLTDLTAAIKYANTTIKADVIFMSWGTNESAQLNSYNNLFTNTAICYCVSSGDSNTVSWPATCANCVAVGGTSLIWSPKNIPERTEYTWSSTGCGYSSFVQQPNYQSEITGITHNNRVIPDVSLVADTNTSVYTVYNGNWYGVGGTSVSAPIFAGILSIANQMRFNQNKMALTTVYSTTPNTVTNSAYIAPKNHLQTYLYRTIYPSSSLYSSVFYDVVDGNNKGSVGGTNLNGLTTYNTGVKFDVPTGLGSPNADNLCNVLLNI